MATKTETNANAGKSTVKAQRLEAREQKKEARAQKSAESGRPERGDRLCTFSTVDVRKSEGGFQIFVTSGERRHKLILARQDIGQILKDLESAMHVIRGQL